MREGSTVDDWPNGQPRQRSFDQASNLSSSPAVRASARLFSLLSETASHSITYRCRFLQAIKLPIFLADFPATGPALSTRLLHRTLIGSQLTKHYARRQFLDVS